MNKFFSYSVAIRTLGKAGDKFKQELISLHKQTVPPTHVFVYLAEGYSRPEFTIGIEEYIIVNKGMVSQRALPYKEVDTDYLLLLDDDVYVPEDGVEKLYDAMQMEFGDCVAADSFHPQDYPLKTVIRDFITNLSYPRRNDGWAFKVNRNASFSYNRYPRKGVYKSQSASGPASFWKTRVFKEIHFEDEKWLDELGFAYGEDLLLFHKLYKNGYKLLVHYGSGLIHLDAGSSRKDYSASKSRLQDRAKIWFILWYRTCFDLTGATFISKSMSVFSFAVKVLLGAMVHLGYSVVKFNPSLFIMFIKGNIQGYRFVLSPNYKKIPNFILK